MIPNGSLRLWRDVSGSPTGVETSHRAVAHLKSEAPERTVGYLNARTLPIPTPLLLGAPLLQLGAPLL